MKVKEKDGVDSVQVGIGEAKLHKLKKPQLGHFLKHNLPPKKHLAEFKVTKENFLPVGYMLGPRHFKLGQQVDCQAVSIGKGTAGTMKRWNFGGGNATHGNSKAHRSAGSIGNAEFPGRVFKGKKMAGRLGFQNATQHNQKIVRIDTERSLLYVKGNTPGPISGVVRIVDSVKKLDR